jgi:hypothetical protein
MGERLNCSLKDILNILEMRPNQLFELTKVRKKVRRMTIYDMHNNKLKNVNLEDVNIILYILNEQAVKKEIKKRFDTQDLFPYVHNEHKKEL